MVRIKTLGAMMVALALSTGCMAASSPPASLSTPPAALVVPATSMSAPGQESTGYELSLVTTTEAGFVTASAPAPPVPATPAPVAVAAAVSPVHILTAAPANDQNLTPDDARRILRAEGSPEEWIEPLIRIGMCESSGGLPHMQLGAIGDSGNSLGAYQTWTGWYVRAGEDINQWRDPTVATRVALYIRHVRGRFGGPGGWTCADKEGIE